MVDITSKHTSLRTATAVATVKTSRRETIEAIEERRVPKGDVFEMAKAAGLLGIKKTADMIPDCHPIPVEYAHIDYRIDGLEITITVDVAAIYRTGVEVEAMHGASVVALTFYDMLKPIDPAVEIGSIKLLQKKGGKSDFRDHFDRELTAAVVVCSDSISQGRKKDRAGKAIIEKLESAQVTVSDYAIIADEPSQIKETVERLVRQNVDLIVLTGGTGLSPRDVTPETLLPMFDREIPGIMEAARNYGQSRTPYAMLSRGVAGIIENSVVLTLPGSTKGAAESMDALFPSLLHLYRIFQGASHPQ